MPETTNIPGIGNVAIPSANNVEVASQVATTMQQNAPTRFNAQQNAAVAQSVGVNQASMFPVIDLSAPPTLETGKVMSGMPPQVAAPQLLTPDVSQKEIPSITASIRQKEQKKARPQSYSDYLEADAATFGKLQSNVPKLYDYSVNFDEVYAKLSDGSYISKVPDYIGGTDNQDRLSQQQGFLSKVGNGLLKFGGKTLTAVAGGTVGIVNGLIEAADQGRFSAIYDNSLNNFLDDLNTKMDYQLPNYKSADERQMSFLRSMATTNFWADDFLSGLSFVSGAILTEGAWAAVTGGTSLVTSAARLAARGGVKAGAAVGGRAAIQEAKGILKAYQRTVSANKWLNATNTVRYVETSAGYESGVEARHSFKDSMENFISSYQTAYGRNPNQEEVKEFTDVALNNANAVFGVNMAIVGSSNLYMLGSYFGLKAGISEAIQKNVGRKVFGNEVVETIGENGVKVYKKVAATKLQRGLETAFNVAKRPFVEGVWEEGMQGVASRTSESWLASRYDPLATRDNLSFIEATMKGFQESYGTREGFKEVGLGMLIGMVGSVGVRNAEGKNALFGFRETKSTANYLNDQITRRNEANKGLEQSLRNTVNRVALMNQQVSALNKYDEALSKGEVEAAAIELDTANYSRMAMQDEMGYFSDATKDMESILDNMTPESLRQQDPSLQNYSDAQLDAYKQQIKEVYQKDAKDFSESLEIAKIMNPSAKSELGNQSQNYTRALALNIYQGRKAMDRIGELSSGIDTLIGNGQNADALLNLSMVSAEKINLARQFNNATKKKAQLESELVTVQQELASVLTKKNEVSETGSEARISETDRLRKKIADITKKITLVNAEQEAINTQVPNVKSTKDILSKSFLGVDVDSLTIEDLSNSLEYAETIRSTVNSLRRNKSIADNTIAQVDLLLQQYMRATNSLDSFISMANRMSDERFKDATEYKGLFRIPSVPGAFMREMQRVSEDWTKIDKSIADQIDTMNLTEEEKYTLATLEQMRVNAVTLEKPTQLSDLREVEPVTDIDYLSVIETNILPEPVAENIVNKKLNNEPLSPREREIYRRFRKDLYSRYNKLRLAEGRKLLKPAVKDETIAERINREIDNAFVQSPTLLEENTKDGKRPTSIEEPTKEEIAEFKKLDRRAKRGDFNKGTLTKKQQEALSRYNELLDKIGKFSNLKGISIADGLTLADAYSFLSQMEESESTPVSHTVTEEDTAAMLHTMPVIAQEDRNAKDMYALVWDKATMSAVSGVEVMPSVRIPSGVTVQGITVRGLLNMITGIQSISKLEHGKSPVEVDLATNPNYRVKPNDYYLVTLENGQQFNIYINSRSNPVFDNTQIPIVEANSELLFQYLGGLEGSYKVLLNKEFKPIQSDYQDVSGKVIDMDAVSSLRIGDPITAKADLDTPYNKELIDEYNKSAKSKEDKDKLRNNLLIELYDSNNHLVGIMKAAHADTFVSEAYFQLIGIRDEMLARIFDTKIKITVKQVIESNPEIQSNVAQRIPELSGMEDKIFFVKEIQALLKGAENKFTKLVLNSVFNSAKQLGVTIQFSTQEAGSDAYFSTKTGNISINLPDLMRSYDVHVSNGDFTGSLHDFLMKTIAHELVHSVTSNAYLDVQKHTVDGNYTGVALNAVQVAATKRLGEIYAYVKDLQVQGQFGNNPIYELNNVYEFIAGLSNPAFIDMLSTVSLPESLQYEAGNTNIFASLLKYITEIFTGKATSTSASNSLINAVSDLIGSRQSYMFSAPVLGVSVQEEVTESEIDGEMRTSGTVSSRADIVVDDTLPGRPNLNIQEGKIIYSPLSPGAKTKVLDFGYMLNGHLHMKEGVSNINTYPFTTHLISNKSTTYKDVKIPVVVIEIGGKKYTYQAKFDSKYIDIVPALQIIANSNITKVDKVLQMNNVLLRNGISIQEYGFTPYDMTQDAFNAKLANIQALEVSEDIETYVKDGTISLSEVLDKVSLEIDLENSPFHSPKFKMTVQPVNVPVAEEETVKLDEEDLNGINNELNTPC